MRNLRQSDYIIIGLALLLSLIFVTIGQLEFIHNKRTMDSIISVTDYSNK